FPNEVDGKQINELTPGCLRKQKGITAVTVPDGITEMDLSIILCENVRELYFGKDLNNIASPMIGSRNLEKIVVDANNPYYFVDNGCLIDRRNNHLILAAKNARIPEYVTWISYFSFGHHHLTEDLIIPDGVKELDEYAFAGLTGNVNVYVPESTQLFGSSFSGCSKSITFWFGNKDSKVGSWMAEQEESPNSDKFLILISAGVAVAVASAVAFRLCIPGNTGLQTVHNPLLINRTALVYRIIPDGFSGNQTGLIQRIRQFQNA
ncbi:leucine-rich repeat protein, partial [Methanocorpusculum sp.]|nr:leucine-rich repeat protein [Methanocorpusculum sp.]